RGHGPALQRRHSRGPRHAAHSRHETRYLMDDGEVFVQSLRNRVRAMNILWERAVSDLTLEQMNHHEREGVLPMAFSFSHFMRAQDQTVSMIFRREPPLWMSGGWAA